MSYSLLRAIDLPGTCSSQNDKAIHIYDIWICSPTQTPQKHPYHYIFGCCWGYHWHVCAWNSNPRIALTKDRHIGVIKSSSFITIILPFVRGRANVPVRPIISTVGAKSTLNTLNFSGKFKCRLLQRNSHRIACRSTSLFDYWFFCNKFETILHLSTCKYFPGFPDHILILQAGTINAHCPGFSAVPSPSIWTRFVLPSWIIDHFSRLTPKCAVNVYYQRSSTFSRNIRLTNHVTTHTSYWGQNPTFLILLLGPCLWLLWSLSPLPDRRLFWSQGFIAWCSPLQVFKTVAITYNRITWW